MFRRMVHVLPRATVCVVLASAAQAQVTLRIATFNTYQGIANTSAEREASGNLLTSLDLDGPGPNTSLMPDVVCLQETRSLSALESFRDDYLPGFTVIKGPTTDGFNSNGYFIRGDLTVLRFDEFASPGPRPFLRVVLDVPGASSPLVVYTAHFKAGGSNSDINTRAAEANALANRISADASAGIDLDGDRQPDFTPIYYVLPADLNHDDFAGTTIDPLLTAGSNGLPTGLNDMRVETLFGQQFPSVLVDTWSTRSSLSRRFDYILVSDALFAVYDTDGDGDVDQNEMNAGGFVYISTDDNGLQASGDVDASSVASDHAVVVVDITLDAGGGSIPGDVDGDGDVDLVDLSLLLNAFGTSSGDAGYDPAADFDGDGDVDLADLSTLLVNFGS